MGKNTKKDIQKKAEIKNQLERISNKTLVIFTVSLIFGIVLLFLYTAFKGVGTYIPKLQGFVTFVSVFTFIGFIALFVTALMLKKKNGVRESLKNWSIVALVISVCSFFIYPVDIVTSLFSMIGLANKGGVIAMKLSKIMGSTAILTIIIGLIVYVIGVFIYYNIKSNKIKNNK